MYIALESIEGAGKGTLINKLLELFPDAVCVREPGGTPNAERIRRIAIGADVDEDPLDPMSELMLFMAARVELLSKIVAPAIKAGKLILSDRSFYSTLAYQGQATPKATNILIDEFIRPIAEPDLVIYLDVDIHTSRARASARGALDQIEMRNDEFFTNARQCFLDKCEELPDIFYKVDATQSREQVFFDVIDILQAKGVELPTLVIER